MPISGSIRPAGAPRVTISGADSPPVFRGEQPAAPPAPAAEQAAPSEIDALREAVAAGAEQRKAAAAERAARVRERAAELAEREKRVDAVEARVRAWRGNPALALQDLREAGVEFEHLVQVIANGGTLTDQQLLAGLQAEVEQLKSGIRDAETRREQRDVADRAASQRAAEEDARESFAAELADAAAQNPERYPLIGHFGDQSADYIWQKAEQMFKQSGEVPSTDQVLDAVERDLAAEIDDAAAARAGRRPMPPARPAPAGARPRAAGATAETESERRARFLGQLGQILQRVR